MLRAAQPFRLLGAEGCRDGAIWPGKPPFRGLVYRPAPWRRDRKNAALAFDQYIASIGSGRRDERNPARLSECCLLADPLRQSSRFPKATASEQQPDLPPIPGRRELIWPRDSGPRILKRVGKLRSERTSHRSQLQSGDGLRAPAPKCSPRRDRAMLRLRPLALLDMAPPRSRSAQSPSCNRD